MPKSGFGRGGAWLMLLILLALTITGCASQRGLERPNGVAIGQDGSLFVMDFGHFRVLQIGQDGRVTRSFGSFGPKQDQIYYGWDLASDSQGNLYFGNVVRDNEGTRHDGVKVFRPDGRFVREISPMDYQNSNDETNLPYAIEVDGSDRLYVANYGSNTVRIYNPAGEMVSEISGSNSPEFTFSNPGDVAVDDQRGLMYISDFKMGRLLQFSLLFNPDGTPQIKYLKAIGKYGRENGQFAFPQNIAVDDKSGIVYVGDMANRRLQAVDSEGNFIASFAPQGVEDWQVLGLVVGPDGTVYAGDALNNAVWAFRANEGMDYEVQRVEVK